MLTLVPIATGVALAGAWASSTASQVTEGTREPLTSAATIYGPTGLIAVPTAYTVGGGQANFGAAFARHLNVPSANYGLIPFVEVGGAWLDRRNADGKLIGNAKVTIIPSNFEYFEVGVGVIDAVDAVNRSFYVVGSADLVRPNIEVEGSVPVGFKVHAGVGSGMFRDRFIGGGELLFGNRFSAIAEYDARNFNAGLRYSHGDTFRIQAGVFDKGPFLAATTYIRF